MDEFELKLKLLSDILAKKANTLEQILTITENQENVLTFADAGSAETIFGEMNLEKQKLIDEIQNADNVFQNAFDEIAPQFAALVESHQELVRRIQYEIKEVTDFDLKIRIQEKKNFEIISQSSKKFRIEAPKASKSYIMRQYNSHKKADKD